MPSFHDTAHELVALANLSKGEAIDASGVARPHPGRPETVADAARLVTLALRHLDLLAATGDPRQLTAAVAKLQRAVPVLSRHAGESYDE